MVLDIAAERNWIDKNKEKAEERAISTTSRQAGKSNSDCSTPEPTYQYFDQLIETKTPIVPVLTDVRIKNNGTIKKELNIIYYNHKKHTLNRIYNNSFATFMFDNLLTFERGISSQILAGIVRPSKPDVVEKWRGDTIEKVNHESFSLYKGLLSIIGKNDGLPLVVPHNDGIVGDIVPGLKKILDGKNPITVRQKLKQLEALQYKISDIIGDNPLRTTPVTAGTVKSTLDDKFHGLNDKQIARLARSR
jgi:hypothetical protein